MLVKTCLPLRAFLAPHPFLRPSITNVSHSRRRSLSRQKGDKVSPYDKRPFRDELRKRGVSIPRCDKKPQQLQWNESLRECLIEPSTAVKLLTEQEIRASGQALPECKDEIELVALLQPFLFQGLYDSIGEGLGEAISCDTVFKRALPATTKVRDCTTHKPKNITRPTPDLTLGFPKGAFGSYSLSRAFLKDRQHPVGRGRLEFPFLCAEFKGRNGDINVARLQNLNNMSLSLDNLHWLYSLSGAVHAPSLTPITTPARSFEHNFVGHLHPLLNRMLFDSRVVLVSLDVSPRKVHLYSHWTSCASGHLQFLSAHIRTWSLPDDINAAILGIHNAKSYVRQQLEPLIHRWMQSLEAKLRVECDHYNLIGTSRRTNLAALH